MSLPAHARGRFAPSPTGPLHFGSLVAAVASYCDARAAGGAWLVRIEDVDSPRARPGAERAILSALERYGFEWDGPVVRQSERRAVVRRRARPAARAGRRLRMRVHAARSRERAARRRRRARLSRHVPRRHSARPRAPQGARRGAFASAPRASTWRDRLQGPQTQDLAREVGDFVVRRADGLFAYQLAVVVDDATQGITDVVRGADLIASTRAPDLAAAAPRLPDAVVPARADRDRRGRTQALEADARRAGARVAAARAPRRVAISRPGVAGRLGRARDGRRILARRARRVESGAAAARPDASGAARVQAGRLRAAYNYSFAQPDPPGAVRRSRRSVAASRLAQATSDATRIPTP